jgi:hypothetical protein
MGSHGPINWQYSVLPITTGAGGVVTTRTVKDERGLSQLPIIWLAYTVYTPTMLVLITGAIILPTPPVGPVYHNTVPVEMVRNGINGVP